MHDHFGDEVPGHLEWVRFKRRVTPFGLPLVRFTTEQRLEEIMRLHEEMGAPIFNPHRYTLEEGGMKTVDPLQARLEEGGRPQGPAQPGKDDRLGRAGFRFLAGRELSVSGVGGGGVKERDKGRPCLPGDND